MSDSFFDAAKNAIVQGKSLEAAQFLATMAIAEEIRSIRQGVEQGYEDLGMMLEKMFPGITKPEGEEK